MARDKEDLVEKLKLRDEQLSTFKSSLAQVLGKRFQKMSHRFLFTVEHGIHERIGRGEG